MSPFAARLPFIRPLLGLAVLMAAGSQAFAQATAPAGPAGPPVEILGLELRREQGRLRLEFRLSAATPFEVVENFSKRVLVVKFFRARAAFPGGKTEFVYNDPFLVGMVLEEVNGATWAKVRVRTPNLAYRVVPSGASARVVVALRFVPPRPTVKLTGVRLATLASATRVVLDLTSLPRYESRREGDRFSVRLSGVRPALATPLIPGDDRISLAGLEREGEDTVLRITVRQEGLRATPLVLTDPPRLVFTFREPAPKTAVRPAKPPPPPQRVDPLGRLLADEQSALVRANYNLAEQNFRVGNFRKAGLTFMRVFRSNPESPLGIRAFFRAADSQFERLTASKATAFHGLIATYQSGIRAAESAGVESDLIPRAFFRIGRSYQKMGFYSEAEIYYRILQDRFPDDEFYTADSYFYQGEALLKMRKYPEAIAAHATFLQGEGEPALIAAANYSLGDVYYLTDRFTEAKVHFDKALRLDSEFPKTRPVLWFHMGETFYANAQFDDARAIYNGLLEIYPGKPYTKLVGLRLGDFLREEGKESDALRIYEGVIREAPLEINLRGKMRIADLLSTRPVGDDFKKALILYGEVIEAGEKRPVVQEASLRRALTLTLHGQNREAVTALLEHIAKFPENELVRHGIVNAQLLENLKSLVDKLFEEEEFWEVVKVYAKYRRPHFEEFPFKVTLFQVAQAYHHLGLFDQALGLYGRIQREKPGSLATLIEYQQALAHSQRDDLLRAEEGMLKFIRAHETDTYLTDVRLRLGKVYFDGRRYTDALNAYNILIQDFEKTRDAKLAEALPEAYYQLGQIYKELGQLKQSVDAFRAASENFHHPIQGEGVPEFIVLSYFVTGDVFFELGQDHEAIAAYETAIARYPDHDKTPWARFQIGLILRRRGDEREALEIFNGLVELAKTRPGELWETLARENQRDLVNSLGYQDYLKK